MKFNANGKRFLAAVGATAVLGTTIIGGVTFASSNTQDKANTKTETKAESPVETKVSTKATHKAPPEMTEEEKAEMEERMKEMEANMKEREEKWNKLDEASKNEIYALEEEKIELEIKSIKKQLELGLIEEKEANGVIDTLKEEAKSIKESGVMPGTMIMKHNSFEGEENPDGSDTIVESVNDGSEITYEYSTY